VLLREVYSTPGIKPREYAHRQPHLSYSGKGHRRRQVSAPQLSLILSESIQPLKYRFYVLPPEEVHLLYAKGADSHGNELKQAMSEFPVCLVDLSQGALSCRRRESLILFGRRQFGEGYSNMAVGACPLEEL
jgi:hypothetical protein